MCRIPCMFMNSNNLDHQSIPAPAPRTMGFPWMRLAQVFLLLVIMFSSSGCPGKRHPKPSKPSADVDAAPEKNAKQKPRGHARGPLAGRAFEVLEPEVLGNAANAPAVAALRKRGLLKATIPCDRPGMCTRSHYDVAVGFEVELIRKIAEWGFGVKENLLEPGAPGADIAAAVPCDSSGAPFEKKPASGRLLAGPYFYRSDTGWQCFEVLRGGPPVADALNRIILHFYDTGTFQQVYKNWFPPTVPDIVPVTDIQ